MIWRCRFESYLYLGPLKDEMTETLNIVMGSEVLLSIAVLSLVLYGINLSTRKMSTGVILMVGIIIGADYFNLGYIMITNC